MKATTAPAVPRHKTTEDHEALAAQMPRERLAEPRFRTVLVPGCGWPTEASVPVSRKRGPKR